MPQGVVTIKSFDVDIGRPNGVVFRDGFFIFTYEGEQRMTRPFQATRVAPQDMCVDLSGWNFEATEIAEQLSSRFTELVRSAASEALEIVLKENVLAYLDNSDGRANVRFHIDLSGDGGSGGPCFQFSLFDIVRHIEEYERKSFAASLREIANQIEAGE